RTEDAERYGEHHRERDAPALVERREEQDDEDRGEAEDEQLRALASPLLEHRARPFVAESGRQNLARDLLHRERRVARAVARCVYACDLRGPEPIVSI